MRIVSASLTIIALCFSNVFSGVLSPSGNSTDTSFFPIAVWLQSEGNVNAYKAAGINMYVGLWQGPTQAQLSALKTANMQVMCDQNAYALANLATYGSIIAAWTQGDEPDNAQSNGSGGYDPCISPDTIIKQYNAWKAADPTRPVYLNLGQGVSYINYIGRGTCSARTDMYPQYLNGCNIGSFDIYPVNSGYTPVRNNLWYVPKGVDSLEMWSNNLKPIWAWIECTIIDSSYNPPRAPTPVEVKAEVWMAIIHGAKGFGYFCHSFYPSFVEAGWLNKPQMRDSITKINRRIDSLAPVLNSPDVLGDVTVQSSNPSVPVDILVKNHGGATYIFAAAMRNDTTTVSFRLNKWNPGVASGLELDANRLVGVYNQDVLEKFTGYGVHLYKFSSPSIRVNPFAAKQFSPTCTNRVLVSVHGKTGIFLRDIRQTNRANKYYSIQGRLSETEPNPIAHIGGGYK